MSNFKRLDNWLQKQRDKHVTISWNCNKGMHKPLLATDGNNDHWICEKCFIFLSENKR